MRFPRPPSLTLSRALSSAAVVLALGGAGLLQLFARGSRRAVLQAADERRDAAALTVERFVTDSLAEAPRALAQTELRLELGFARLDEPLSLEPVILGALLDHPSLREVTVVHGRVTGAETDGTKVLAPEQRWQLTVHRGTGPDVRTRWVEGRGTNFRARGRA